MPTSKQVGKRVRETIAEAERAAHAMRRDAERHAREVQAEAERSGERLIEDAARRADGATRERVARLRELAETIAARADALTPPAESEGGRIVVEEVRNLLEGTAAELAAEVSSPAPAVDPDVPLPPRRRFARAGETRRGGNTRESRARLVAQQMVAAGGRREEIEKHLRRAFGLDNPARVAEQAFARATADAS